MCHSDSGKMPFICIAKMLVKALDKLFSRLANGSCFGTIIHFASVSGQSQAKQTYLNLLAAHFETNCALLDNHENHETSVGKTVSATADLVFHRCKFIPICGCAQNVIGVIQDNPLGECFWSHSKLMILHGNVVPLITQLCLQFRLHRYRTCGSGACGL